MNKTLAEKILSYNSSKRRTKDLRYNMYGSPDGHPQKIMAGLGIKYQVAVPQSMGDQWWFFNCENIPSPLPDYLEELTGLDKKPLNPYELVGYGLSIKDADLIVNYG